MKSKLFKEFIAEQSPRDSYYRRGSAEARSTEAEQARRLQQQTQQSVTDYARKQGLTPSDVINQVKTSSNDGPSYQSPASIPTVKKPGDLPPDVERAAKLLSDPKTNWRDLSKPDPVLPPGAVGNIINALPPNIGPVPVRGPATFLRSLITPKVSKPLSVTPEIGIPPPMSRGITSQTSGDIAAGIAKAEKAARDRAGVRGASDTMPTTTSKPATNEPVAPVQGQTATTSTPKTRYYEPVDLEKKFADIRAARDARTQHTPEPPAKIPTTNKASSDPTTSTRVDPRLDLDAIDSAIAASKAGTAKNTSTATAPVSLRYRDYGSREGMAPRLPRGTANPADSSTTAPPANIRSVGTPDTAAPAANGTSRGYGRAAVASAGLAAPASLINPSVPSASATTGAAGTAAPTAIPLPAASVANNQQINAANTRAWVNADPDTKIKIQDITGTSSDKFRSMAGDNIGNAPAAPSGKTRSVVTPVAGTAAPNTASTVSSASNNEPFKPQDREGGGVGDDVRLRAMQYLSGQRPDASGQMNKNAPGVNPQAWSEKELKNLQTSLPQGQGMTEAIRELKKLSGLIK